MRSPVAIGLALTLGLAVLLSGCFGSSSSPPPSSSPDPWWGFWFEGFAVLLVVLFFVLVVLAILLLVALVVVVVLAVALWRRWPRGARVAGAVAVGYGFVLFLLGASFASVGFGLLGAGLVALGLIPFLVRQPPEPQDPRVVVLGESR